MHILFAESDPAISVFIAGLLSSEKYTVDAVATGLEALACASTQAYDGMVFSAVMPGMDGLALLREIRTRGNVTPVLLLGCSSPEDRARALDAGADDCIPLPFATNEFIARIRAMLRRRNAYTPDHVYVGNLLLDQHQAMICCDGEPLRLSRLEYQLLSLFMLHPGMSFSAEHLLEQVWGMASHAETGSVWVYISSLRKKLSTCASTAFIRSKRGIGYSLEIQRQPAREN